MTDTTTTTVAPPASATSAAPAKPVKPTDDEIEAVARGMDYAGALNWDSKDHDGLIAISNAKADALHMILGVKAVAGMAAAVSKIQADRAAKKAAEKAKADAAAAKAKADADAAAKVTVPPPPSGVGTTTAPPPA